MNINVFKFGGASIKDAQGIKNVADILAKFSNQKIATVVSATGKSTNQLENVVKAYLFDEGDPVLALNIVKQNHIKILEDLGITDADGLADVMDSFVEIDWVIEDEPHDPYDYIYDQIVSVGEVVSSKIVYHYLKSIGVNVGWLDVRDVLFTDEIHREAKVDWSLSTHKIKKVVKDMLQSYDLIITQGFIGSTTDNHTTTLGREGSDYTAAILSFCLDAEGMHIWKDVPGVLTADPRKFDNYLKIERLSYKEAIEMTYYGAKVIHPKTIKPIQNKNIPLYVRPFGDPASLGTTIATDGEMTYPPIIVVEPDQCLVHISVNDFSFVAEHHMSNIFKTLADLRLKVNMMRNTAISFTICIQNDAGKIVKLKDSLSQEFSVTINEGLELITIRHSLETTELELKKGKLVLFEERLNDMIQMVVKDIPLIKRK